MGMASKLAAIARSIFADTGGNVGFGLAPSYKVDIADNTTGTQMRLSGSGGNGVSINLNSTSTNGRQYRIGSNFVTATGEFAIYDATGAKRLYEITPAGGHLSSIEGQSGMYSDFRCRAWVNFNGTGTVAIRAGGNVSSISDFGTGQYGINFTASMPDAHYVLGGSASYSAAGTGFVLELDETGTASQAKLITNTLTGAAADSANVNITIHR